MLTPRIARYVRQHFEDPDAGLVVGAREGIDSAFRVAERDWRDLLVSAGLENEDWPQLLDLRLGPEVA